MEKWQKEFTRWKQTKHLDENLKKQLLDMETDEVKIKDAFYQPITFGTGGMRGIIGPGISRMNIYTVRKAVEGLANYLRIERANYKDRGVVIGYDPRHLSKEFALESAKVLGAHGIRAYVFDNICPTPLLSYAVRYFRASAGIMITASHNPPEYNGFKVYNEEGSQITSEEADRIIEQISLVEDELRVEAITEDELNERHLLNWVNEDVHDAYLEQLKTISKFDEKTFQEEKDLRIVYSPLHGTGSPLVEKGFAQLNFTNVYPVAEQLVPDPEFSTVASPNPEEPQAFTRAIEVGNRVNADILLATDPDADRLGAAVKNSAGNYEVLTGNQLGCLMLDYLLRHTDEHILKSARMIKTIVTTELGRTIASRFNVPTIDTLTGFKYIGEKINEFDTTGETFLFGFEESFGYLINPFARDKDGVQAAVMAAEVAHFWKRKGMTLLEALNELYETYGYYKEGLDDIKLEGVSGQQQIKQFMDSFRNEMRESFGDLRTVAIEDYLERTRTFLTDHQVERLTLPQENVVKYKLEDDCWICFRPSGTEPKLKWYYGAYGKTELEVNERLTMLQETLQELMMATLK